MDLVTAPTADRVVCGFCAETFSEDLGQPVCRACPLSGMCHQIRCPKCGYENPLPPAWLRALTRKTSR